MITVGAGTAGCVVANRLSEDGNVTVALLEAGKDSSEYPMSAVPLAAPQLQNTEADWAYRTIPQQRACLGMKDKVMSIPDVD